MNTTYQNGFFFNETLKIKNIFKYLKNDSKPLNFNLIKTKKDIIDLKTYTIKEDVVNSNIIFNEFDYSIDFDNKINYWLQFIKQCGISINKEELIKLIKLQINCNLFTKNTQNNTIIIYCSKKYQEKIKQFLTLLNNKNIKNCFIKLDEKNKINNWYEHHNIFLDYVDFNKINKNNYQIIKERNIEKYGIPYLGNFILFANTKKDLTTISKDLMIPTQNRIFLTINELTIEKEQLESEKSIILGFLLSKEKTFDKIFKNGISEVEITKNFIIKYKHMIKTNKTFDKIYEQYSNLMKLNEFDVLSKNKFKNLFWKLELILPSFE